MRAGCFVCVVLLVTACATVEQRQLAPVSELDKQAAWEARRITLETLQTWRLAGRVAGRSDNEGFRAGVRWRQQRRTFSIDVHGPLGRKVAVLHGRGGTVKLHTAKGDSYAAQDAEALMQDLFGYSLPVHGLRYWMRGMPDPEQVYASLELDRLGRLQQLSQAGWLIDYKRYHHGELALPAFIRISNADLDANIIIDHWSLNVPEH